MLRRSKSWFLTLMVTLFCVSPVLAAVTVVDFFAEGYEDQVSLFWETASETGNAGFYVWRSDSEFGDDYEMIAVFNVNLEVTETFIPGEGDDTSGGSYEVEDRNVEPGRRYYYKLADSPSDEAIESTFSDPVSATVLGTAPPATSTKTPTPTPTSTPTPTPSASGSTPVPTATPEQIPSVSFTADRTVVPADACATLQWQTSNVKSVFFDNSGVSGIGAKSFCPCAPETHVLRVIYHDDSSENFEIALTVDGTCSASQVTATPTSEAPDATPVATSTLPPAGGDDTSNKTPSVGTNGTPTPPPLDEPASSDGTAESVGLDISVTPDALGMPSQGDDVPPPAEALSSTTGVPIVRVPESDAADQDKAASPFRGTLVLLMMAVGLIGAGLVGGGIWLWRQQS